MIRAVKSVLLMGALVALVSGCASVAMAPQQADASAKTFAVSKETANVYIYRNEVMGAALKFEVAVDGKLLGKTASKTYFLVSLAPGKHTIVSQQDPENKLDITVEAGKNYFVWQEVKMGMWSGGSKLNLVDEAKGKAGVAESSLIAAAQ